MSGESAWSRHGVDNSYMDTLVRQFDGSGAVSVTAGANSELGVGYGVRRRIP